jgi:hypothetical protein
MIGWDCDLFSKPLHRPVESAADYGSSAADQRSLRERPSPRERQLARPHNIKALAKSFRVDGDPRSGTVTAITAVIAASGNEVTGFAPVLPDAVSR